MSTTHPRIPDPCHEDWAQMTPEERGHFCNVCQTKVWDLSSMTREEARSFLEGRNGADTCISFRERDDGEVQYRDSAVVPRTRLVRRLPIAAGLSLALAACDPATDPAPTEQSSHTGEAEPTKPVPDEPTTKEVRVGKWEVDDPEAITDAPSVLADPPTPTPTPATGDAEASPDSTTKPEEPTRQPHVKGKWKQPEQTKPIKKGKVAVDPF